MTSLPPATTVLRSALAEAVSAPEDFLSKVLQALARAGLIASRRGPNGGFELVSAGRLATVLDVVQAVDGPIRLNQCLGNGRSCNRQTFCPAHPVWVEAQEAMLNVLRHASIAQLAKPGSALAAQSSSNRNSAKRRSRAAIPRT
jgi:Rrf2 family protein